MKKEEYLKYAKELTDWDHEVFKRITNLFLTKEQEEFIINPENIYKDDEEILAAHFHPEQVPVSLLEQRVDNMFPNATEKFLIPTQHNIILSSKGYSGVEVDCYAPEFNRKVQLLLHFKDENVKEAHTLKAMLQHTFKYRSSQLYSIIETILNPENSTMLNEAIKAVEPGKELLEFVKEYTAKFQKLLEFYRGKIKKEVIKNKLLPAYFTALVEFFDEHQINKAKIFIKRVKKIVKKYFNLEYFYDANEVIEEARSLGGGIVIPHPEQFWPVLMTDYDIDGIEVWNPQSREFTDFLIDIVIAKNKQKQYARKPYLIFMGDDTHMGEKLKPKHEQDETKVAREIGLQPLWNDMSISKKIIKGGAGRKNIIEEYKNRLNNKK